MIDQTSNNSNNSNNNSNDNNNNDTKKGFPDKVYRLLLPSTTTTTTLIEPTRNEGIGIVKIFSCRQIETRKDEEEIIGGGSGPVLRSPHGLVNSWL